ncbi:MAG: hypothetical protein QMD46_06395 [Methanomicrobiales archaeon]|nr:hypothetical protein [Methanomicrobiales archaeon]MDI6876104.1 hypothetical protein [Methanomicrobiales archaeon]
MIPICILYADAVADTRLKDILDRLTRSSIDRQKVIEHEIDRDRFIRNFIRHFESTCPDPAFVVNRLRLAGAIAEES